MPFQIGALVDGAHHSASEAGLFGFFEVGALAFGMILICAWVDRVSLAAISLGGCLLAAVANVGLYAGNAANLGVVMLFAVLAGLGYGAVFSATVAAAAATREPDRLYALGNGGALLLIVGIMSVFPAAAAHLGALGVFAALAGLAIVSAPFFLALQTGTVAEETRLSAWRTPGAPALLCAWSTFSMGTGALYAFSERIGKSIHLEPSQIATALSMGVFVGLIGTGAAAFLGRRVNRAVALMVGMSGSGLSCLLLGFATNEVLFTAGVFLYWIFYMFLYSYLLGTAAILDPSGRVGTLGGGLERLGYGLGAGLGGIFSEHLAYSSTGVLGFVGCVAGLLGLPSLLKSVRSHASSRAGGPTALPANL